MGQPRPCHDTAPSTQSKDTAHRDCTTPRHHLCCGVHSKGHARPTPRHLCTTGVVEGHHLGDQTKTLHRRCKSKGTAHPRPHNATTPPVSWGMVERACEAETAPPHLCATGEAAGHRLAETHERSTRARTTRTPMRMKPFRKGKTATPKPRPSQVGGSRIHGRHSEAMNLT